MTTEALPINSLKPKLPYNCALAHDLGIFERRCRSVGGLNAGGRRHEKNNRYLSILS